MTIRLLLFDIGGVLLRTEDPQPRLALSLQYGLGKGGAEKLVFHSPAALRAEVGEGGDMAVWEHVRSALALDEEGLFDFQRRFWSGDRADAAIFEYLAARPEGVQSALLTNSWLDDPLAPFWNTWGLDEGLVRRAVERVFSSARLGVRKPENRAFEQALETCGVRAEETVFVDDFIENIHAARDLGINAIHFRGREDCLRRIEALMAEACG